MFSLLFDADVLQVLLCASSRGWGRGSWHMDVIMNKGVCSWRLSLWSWVPEHSGEGWNVCVSKATVTDFTYPAEWRGSECVTCSNSGSVSRGRGSGLYLQKFKGKKPKVMRPFPGHVKKKYFQYWTVFLKEKIFSLLKSFCIFKEKLSSTPL